MKNLLVGPVIYVTFTVVGVILLVIGLVGIHQAIPILIQEQSFLEFLTWLMAEGGAYTALTVVGGVFLGLGLFASRSYILRRRTVQHLKTQGKIIHGKVSEIYKDPYTRVKDEHPWRVAVQWMNPDSGRVHTFQSDQVWYNPSDFVKIGDEIEVRIDPKNPKKHWVNIDHLPQGAD